MKLYKYRSLDNMEFLLDIIVNSRLYAATYESLNDPMEGFFRYKSSEIGRNLLSEIRAMKKETRILSLVQTPYDMLMWSYYANGHNGVAFEVTIVDNDDHVLKPVNYREEGPFITRVSRVDAAVAELLTTKFAAWEHEGEVRILTQKSFVKVKIV